MNFNIYAVKDVIDQFCVLTGQLIERILISIDLFNTKLNKGLIDEIVHLDFPVYAHSLRDPGAGID